MTFTCHHLIIPPVLGIIITPYFSVVKTESLFPHFEDECPWPGWLGGPCVADAHRLAGGVVTAKLEAAAAEGLGATLGALSPLTRVNRDGPGIFERFEEITNVVCLLLLWTQNL